MKAPMLPKLGMDWLVELTSENLGTDYVRRAAGICLASGQPALCSAGLVRPAIAPLPVP